MRRLNYLIRFSIIHPNYRDTISMNSYYDRGKRTKIIDNSIRNILKDIQEDYIKEQILNQNK